MADPQNLDLLLQRVRVRIQNRLGSGLREIRYRLGPGRTNNKTVQRDDQDIYFETDLGKSRLDFRNHPSKWEQRKASLRRWLWKAD